MDDAVGKGPGEDVGEECPKEAIREEGLSGGKEALIVHPCLGHEDKPHPKHGGKVKAKAQEGGEAKDPCAEARKDGRYRSSVLHDGRVVGNRRLIVHPRLTVHRHGPSSVHLSFSQKEEEMMMSPSDER